MPAEHDLFRQKSVHDAIASRLPNLIDHAEAEKSLYFAEGTGPAGVFDWED